MAKRKTSKKPAARRRGPAKRSAARRRAEPKAKPKGGAAATPAPPPAVDRWPTEAEWRQSGLCPEAQADGVPCSLVGRRCELCDRAVAEQRGKGSG